MSVNPLKCLKLPGKGRTQQRATDELIALSQDNSFRSRALELLASWRITIEASELIDTETQELIMQLSPAYIKWCEETLQAGRQEGRQEGEERLVLRLLTRRMGELSPEVRSQIQSLSLPQLDSLGETLLDFSNPSDLRDWLSSL
jgi:flagellar biosynthesis/type III secretory pathway protein FliH